MLRGRDRRSLAGLLAVLLAGLQPPATWTPAEPVERHGPGDEAWPDPIAAGADDPIFTTYAAPLERSGYLVDEGYHLRFYAPGGALALTTDTAGDWGVGFELGGEVVHAVGRYFRAPVLRRSYPSLARLGFAPFADIEVDATFAVHSSRAALLALAITNRGASRHRLGIYAYATAPATGPDPAGFPGASLTPEGDGLLFGHSEPRDAWSESPPPEYENVFHDLLLLWVLGGGGGEQRADAFGGYRTGEAGMLRELRRGLVSGDLTGRPRALLLKRTLELAAGETVQVRLVRAVSPLSEGTDGLIADSRALMEQDTEALERAASALLARAPRLDLAPAEELVYRSALSLARQCMLPPEGRTRFNYYVFSREPTWSWGHDGQVFHESISMLAYAHLDPRGAMDSQRVFMEAQDADGYIPYRIGPYVVRTFPVKGRRTTSAPFFSWTNWEIYRIGLAAADREDPGITRDEVRQFLAEAYEAGVRFAEFLLRERDGDGDGLLEWGGHAVLESVRDSLVPLWELLGRDDPTAPSRVEALDLNAMMVRETTALAEMAAALGRAGDAATWRARAAGLARRIEATMWDEETRFYYNVDRPTNRFTTPEGVDLRRMEIIGFLPLWAGIASQERARALVGHLTDPGKFWRRFGVPTLAADDPGYEPLVTRCCQWNGAVWLQWNYLVFDGLRRYGYDDVARELAHRMIAAASAHLRRDHQFRESYSPDEVVADSPRNYIWNSILARVLIDLSEP